MKRIFLILSSLFFITSNVIAQQIQNPVFFNDNNIWADSILENLTIDEKIGQLFMVQIFSDEKKMNKEKIKKLIEDQKIGGIIYSKGGPVSPRFFPSFDHQKACRR